MLRRTPFASKAQARPERRDRSEEFASFVLRPASNARMATAMDLKPTPLASYIPPRRTPEEVAANDGEREHMGLVKSLRCVLCAKLGMQQDSITDVHHMRTEQGGAQRASNWLVASLCHERCHQGPRGIHGDRSLLRQARCTEIDLLAWTLEALYLQAVGRKQLESA